MPSLARWFALGLLIFGAAATVLGGVGAAGGVIGFAGASGCDRMAASVFGIAGLVLLALGVPHLLAAGAWLRGAPSGRRGLTALCGFNLVINLIVVAFVALGDRPALSVIWLALAALNAFGLALLRTSPNTSA